MIVLELPIGEPEPEPHPDLIASITPSPADIMHVALRNGWYPDPPFFRPALPIRQED